MLLILKKLVLLTILVLVMLVIICVIYVTSAILVTLAILVMRVMRVKVGMTTWMIKYVKIVYRHWVSNNELLNDNNSLL